MYAIIRTGGKQYRAAKGDVLRVEKIDAETGQDIELGEVLMLQQDDGVVVGTPLVEGCKVSAKVLRHGRAGKIRVIKFRRRKNSRTTRGHRQHYTDLQVTGIST